MLPVKCPLVNQVKYARTAYKPDFVPRGCPQFNDHSSQAPVTKRPLAANPDRLGFKHPRLATRGPYLALLPVGLAVPLALPLARWALTPPFHHDLTEIRLSVLCGAIPRVTPAGCYPAPCFLESGLSSTLLPQPSSHPRTPAPKPKWRLRQRGNGGPDR